MRLSSSAANDDEGSVVTRCCRGVVVQFTGLGGLRQKDWESRDGDDCGLHLWGISVSFGDWGWKEFDSEEVEEVVLTIDGKVYLVWAPRNLGRQLIGVERGRGTERRFGAVNEYGWASSCLAR